MEKRSFLSVFAGLVFVIAAVTLIDLSLLWAGVLPPADQPMGDSLAFLAMSYRIVIGIAGAWLTAWLAPSRPMTQALVLGCIVAALSLTDLVASFGDGLQPNWYPISLTLLAIPRSWVGARLFESMSSARAMRSSADANGSGIRLRLEFS